LHFIDNYSTTHVEQYLLMSRVDCTVWRQLSGRDIVLVCSRVCNVKTSCRMGSDWSARSTSMRCDVVEEHPVSRGWWYTAWCMAGIDLRAMVNLSS